jgi:hypothetical protein
MVKLQSKDIEWQTDDVMAIVDNKTNDVVLRYTFTRRVDAAEGFYVVMREVDAVEAAVDAIEKICLADMKRQKEQQVTEEVLHGLFDKKRDPWVNLACLCKKVAISDPVEAFADSEPATAKGGFLSEAMKSTQASVKIAIDNAIKNSSEEKLSYNKEEFAELTGCKPTYTQAMKDAGELPSVGMECMWECGMYEDRKVEILCINGDYHWLLIDGEQSPQTVGNISGLKPIDTRTDERKQKAINLHNLFRADLNHEWDSLSDLVKSGWFRLVDAGVELKEIKS